MKIINNYPLAPYTTVKIGGPADTFIIIDSTTEFIDILTKIDKNDLLTVLGNGSNTLISDSGIRGIVIKNLSNNIEYLPDNIVKADSGVQLDFLIKNTTNHNLSDLEEFAYIPSTLGGAIYGNIHGFNKNNFNKLLKDIEIFDLSLKKKTLLPASQLDWGYDFSEFQSHPNWIILSATLQLSLGNMIKSKKIIADIIALKSQTQSLNSLGSVFKNPSGDSAGRIIDQNLNLKGFRLNQVQVSPTHANFIINLGGGTASDYLALIKKIQSEAKSKLNINLEPEIKFLGNFS